MKGNIFIKTLLVGLFFQNLALKAQIRNPVKGRSVSVTGMIGANHTYYSATGIPNRTLPLNFLYTGNLTANIFGKIRMPVSFSLSNQNINFSHPFDRNYRFAQPFNRLILKPTYKGLTFHLGTASMSFSPYTLAGHRFDGIGLEYKPGNKPFYIGAMAGNLQRAVRVDTAFVVRNNRPSYRRTGWGVMGGLRKKQDKIELIFFRAADKLNSLPYSLDQLNISPVENAVISIKAEKSLLKLWQIGGELAYSGITTDTRTPAKTDHSSFRFFGTISPKTATDYLKAVKGFLNYRGKAYSAGIEYSRIDPGYRTLGAYYFNNDLETWSAKLASNLLQGKLTIAGNLGLQSDNVWKQKPKTLKRTVGSANVTFVPNDKININIGYSSFSSFSNLLSSYEYMTQATPYNYLDTLSFRQINSNLQGNISWGLPSKNEKHKHSFSLVSIIQRGGDQQGTQNSDNNLSNFSLDYHFEIPEKFFGATTSLYYSKASFGNMPDTRYGPSAGVNKAFGKLKNNLNFIYTWGNMPGVKEKITNIRYGASYPLRDQHQLKFDVILLDRNVRSVERSIPNFTELTVTLGYLYNFKLLDKKIK